MKNIFIVTLITIVFCIAIGCAGSHVNLKFDNLRYPCSTSAFLYGPHDEILIKDDQLETISKFRYQQTFWGIGWSFIPLSTEDELVSKMNSEIESVKADGMINLTIISEQSAINSIPILNLLPLWPGATNVTVEGEIVKLKK